MQRFTPLARNLAQSEDELPIITMLLDDYYQQTLHAPPVQLAADTVEEGSQFKPRPNPSPSPSSRPKPQNGRPRSRNRKPRTA